MKDKLLLLRNQLKMGHRISFAEAMLLQRAIDILVNKAGSPPEIPDAWIPVSERMPDEGGRYLAWVQQQNDLGLSQWADNVGYQPDSLGFRVTGRVTHWMPMPNPPKE
ncbi:DUF551 domain-containing protein [Klebsiella variicola]|uniref:DUF551 domain-containing protein n=1 Tax=Klebsiella variicola TaxID=244366 RepID=UPI000C7A752C|nr:DUF551 domain-containing protein [Klebsiella variicola]PLK30950.1 hypothetical protein CYD38_30115 [Klebsiella variicola]REI39228.1 DUF551 domain-containing protein [Klebsiella variicola]REI43765.1 DUF551 domain-containing protein [Klebsiella variicola]REI55477.1 DUF551 domain-containing protein [Klebsiella variicola]REI58004.1 DUF551 domain-containing protein [Klebsiella variicola]